jgi:IPT/TIG domain-containing protein
VRLRWFHQRHLLCPIITKFQKAGVDVESGQVGETIVILGENLKGTATEIKFGTVTATVTPENIQPGKINVIIPNGLTPSPEGIDVTVTTTPGGSGKKKFIITAP